MSRTNAREKVVPIPIRNHIENYGDPYVLRMKPEEVAVCRECKAVFACGRWQLHERAAAELKKAGKIIETTCPACRKIHDHQPGGIVNLSGEFLRAHETEIVNLINHENREAMGINPLERIMDIERSDSGLTVYTTNEKLAQKIGRSVHNAYSGDVEYKWSEDTRLVRVNWYRR